MDPHPGDARASRVNKMQIARHRERHFAATPALDPHVGGAAQGHLRAVTHAHSRAAIELDILHHHSACRANSYTRPPARMDGPTFDPNILRRRAAQRLEQNRGLVQRISAQNDTIGTPPKLHGPAFYPIPHKPGSGCVLDICRSRATASQDRVTHRITGIFKEIDILQIVVVNF